METMQRRLTEMLSAGIGVPICLEHFDPAEAMNQDEIKGAGVCEIAGWVDGNLPVELSALPVLGWLAYLADPSVVGWKHIEISAFD